MFKTNFWAPLNFHFFWLSRNVSNPIWFTALWHDPFYMFFTVNPWHQFWLLYGFTQVVSWGMVLRTLFLSPSLRWRYKPETGAQGAKRSWKWPREQANKLEQWKGSMGHWRGLEGAPLWNSKPLVVMLAQSLLQNYPKWLTRHFCDYGDAKHDQGKWYPLYVSGIMVGSVKPQ